MDKPDDLVTLGSFDLALAHIIKGALDNIGIESMISNELMSTIYALPASSIGQAKVLVFRRDYDKALEMLRQNEEEYTATDPDDSEE